MINDLKYIKKEVCKISIPNEYDSSFGINRYNPRNYSIITNDCRFSIRFNIINGERFEKTFYVFAFLGDNFPILSHKKKLLILNKYKFSKVYIFENNNLQCLYFKRGVLFETEHIKDENENILQLKRFFKLMKLKNQTIHEKADHDELI